MSEATITAIATIAATLISVIGTGLWLGRGQREIGKRLDQRIRDSRREFGDGLRAVRLEAERAHDAIGENIHWRTRSRRIQRNIRDTDRWW